MKATKVTVQLISAVMFLFLINGCQGDNDRTFCLSGTINNSDVTELYLTDPANRSYSDTIRVVDGKYTYCTKAEMADISVFQNQKYGIEITFVSEPGKYKSEWSDGDYTITGNLNNKIKQYYSKAMKLVQLGSPNLIQLENQDPDIYTRNIKDLIHEMVTEHQDNGISTFALAAGSTFLKDDKGLLSEENGEFMLNLYNNSDSALLTKTRYGPEAINSFKRTKSDIARTKTSLSNPQILPNLSVHDSSNQSIDFSEIVQGNTYVNFWASWCQPCIKKIPDLIRLSKEHKDINFISISIDQNEKAWLNSPHRLKIPGKQYIVKNENSDLISDHWGIVSIPHGVLLNGKGETLQYSIKTVEALEDTLVGVQ